MQRNLRKALGNIGYSEVLSTVELINYKLPGIDAKIK